jgi:hypothetical protein
MVLTTIDRAAVDRLPIPKHKNNKMNQKDFIEMILRRHEEATPYALFLNWNAYKDRVGFRNSCSYPGFRRAIWKLTTGEHPFLIARRENPDAEEGSKDYYFGTSFYRLARV